MKSMLVISQHPPLAGLTAREALDMVLAGAAFEIPLAMLFIGDGVFQLQAHQQPKLLGQKDLAANLQALEMFGVETLYVDQQSLSDRGLCLDDLIVSCQLLPSAKLSQTIAQFDQVMSL